MRSTQPVCLLLTEFSRTGSRDGYCRAEYSVFKSWTTFVDARRLDSRVAVPVPLVYGGDDWSKLAERERNRQVIAHAESITIEKSGHFTALERSADVAGIILRAEAFQSCALTGVAAVSAALKLVN